MGSGKAHSSIGIPLLLKPFGQPTASTIQKTALYWCAWWFTAGHKMDVFIEDEPEDDEE